MTDLRVDDFDPRDQPSAEDSPARRERVADANGDELERGAPDVPGQFPEEVVPHG